VQAGQAQLVYSCGARGSPAPWRVRNQDGSARSSNASSPRLIRNIQWRRGRKPGLPGHPTSPDGPGGCSAAP
jgi:hypothetical protein